MDLSNQIMNDLIKLNYEFAQKMGLKQYPFYEVQQDGNNFNVLKNGDVVGTFDHPIKANTFMVGVENG